MTQSETGSGKEPERIPRKLPGKGKGKGSGKEPGKPEDPYRGHFPSPTGTTLCDPPFGDL